MSSPIRALADEYWEAVLRVSPTYATFLGDRRFDTEIEDVSLTAEAEQRARWSELHERATATEATTPEDRVTRDLMIESLADAIGHIDHRIAELRYDQMDGLAAGLLTSAPQINAPEPQNALDLVERQRKVGDLVDGAISRFQAGLGAGRTQPRVVVERALHQIDGYLASPLDEDPFGAFQGPADWDGETRWRNDLRAAAEEVVRPAFARYAAVLRDEALPVARSDEEAGLCHLADGEEIYRFLMRSNTGLDLDPADVHQIGLDEVAALDAQVVELGGRMFGATTLPEVFERLRTDPALRYVHTQEPVDDSVRFIASATEAMGAWFGRLPVSPCVVKPVPEMLEADAPGAYYFPPAADGSRPGTYFVNTYEPTERNRFETASTTFHEAIPGHHLQLAIASELDDLPAFQRFSTGHTAYVEGWALYAERLADEMGLYATDLDRMGMLVNESWRACRLVVDTGMHALGWTRQQAIDHMVAHMPVSVEEITTEVDRYLAIPGQALAYKIGQREILRLRGWATERLGERFDLPGFHDVVLGSSTISLTVLGSVVADWVERTAA